eukprot:gene10951-7789_t
MMVTLRSNAPSFFHQQQQQPVRGGDGVVEIEWDAVVQQFHQAFRETFSRSKKKVSLTSTWRRLWRLRLRQAHFDFLPPELRVVDGARDRWYPLLLLDAAWGLLWSNDFQFASKKAFNQRRVLYDSIAHVLRDGLCVGATGGARSDAPSDDEDDAPAMPGWQWPPADRSPSLLSGGARTPSASAAAMYALAEDGSVRRVVHTLKDPVAFACAKDAARSFPNLRTVFARPPPALLCGRRVGASAAAAGSSHGAGTGRSYCFPSPFVSQAPTTAAAAAAVSFDDDEDDGGRWCDVDSDALFDRASSPWATVRGFEALALSDPPAKSRSRFEAAVALLAAHAADDAADAAPGDSDELDALLHLVVCKVLWHEAFVVRRDATLRVAVRRRLLTATATAAAAAPPHRPRSSPPAAVAVVVGEAPRVPFDDAALSPLLWWVSTEETLMDDGPDARRLRDTDADTAADADAIVASADATAAAACSGYGAFVSARSSSTSTAMRKRRRIDSTDDSDSDASVAATTKKQRRVGDPRDAVDDDEDVFMASFTAATHALDLWAPL